MKLVPTSLLQSIEGLSELANPRITIKEKALGWYHIDFFLQVSMEKGIADIHLR